MLEHCAPGFVMAPHGDHKISVKWRGRAFWTLPCGERSKRRAEIQKGHVRGLVSTLGIDPDCAASHLRFLR